MQTSVHAVRPNLIPVQPVEPVAILREVFELLEDYAPIWYTERLHSRMAAALGEHEIEPLIS
jgi:hypothetical protein